jgi:hypothetical protein
MKTFKFKRVIVDYCDIEATDIDAAWEAIYLGVANWDVEDSCKIEEVTRDE